jgi:hypothetical protein
MSAVLDRPAVSLGFATWSSPAQGLWTSSRSGEYVGMVEAFGLNFRATDSRGRTLGTYETLGEAKNAVARVSIVSR